jgi:hypothetical protein
VVEVDEERLALGLRIVCRQSNGAEIPLLVALAEGLTAQFAFGGISSVR